MPSAHAWAILHRCTAREITYHHELFLKHTIICRNNQPASQNKRCERTKSNSTIEMHFNWPFHAGLLLIIRQSATITIPLILCLDYLWARDETSYKRNRNTNKIMPTKSYVNNFGPLCAASTKYIYINILIKMLWGRTQTAFPVY